MKKIAADRNYRMFRKASPGPKGIEVSSIEEAAKYYINKVKAAAGNPPDLRIDTGKSNDHPDGLYFTVLSSSERPPKYMGRLGIDQMSYDLIKGFKQDGGFFMQAAFSGWQKPPSSWGYDPKWSIMENWTVRPYTAYK